ncbi:MAG: FprA family A-type flavoprotein [Solobacterium sp.]|nr:FprA family A-type flavoprotein [Solobacterium sp.]
MKVTEDIYYVGVNDHQIDLFEAQYEVPLGMAYNSYLIVDEKIALTDTVEENFKEEWLKNIQDILQERTPDYLILHHMEPDHSSSLERFFEVYPNTTAVLSQQAFNLLKQFYPSLENIQTQIIKDGDTLSLGKHELSFVSAPMVHWPEVMMSYDAKDKVLFSADAFGKFGANDVEDPEGWTCEARRYYFGIVGKHGTQVQALLKKLEGKEVECICSLHGPVLKEEVKEAMRLYQVWSSYEAEEEGIFIAYASIYGHTKEAAEALQKMLNEKGYTNVIIADLCREDIYECVENAFRYSKMVLASVTYDTKVFTPMREFIEHLVHRNYQKRTLGIIENGSWGPQAAKGMKEMFETSKEINWVEPVVTIKGKMTEANYSSLEELASSLL